MVETDYDRLVRLGSAEAWNAWRREKPEAAVNLDKCNLVGLFWAPPPLDKPDEGPSEPRNEPDSLGGERADGAHGWRPVVVGHRPGAGKGAKAQLQGIDLRGASLREAFLEFVDMTGADLSGADLDAAVLTDATLNRACLDGAVLHDANLRRANLKDAKLREANLMFAQMNRADLRGANVAGSTVYGVSAWDVRTDASTVQTELDMAYYGEAQITVDDLEVAQFINLLLQKEKLRGAIDTIGNRGVLILGRFGDRKHILDKLRVRLRQLGFAPMVFDFEKPVSKDFTETVRTLAGISAFIVADITAPRSVQQEAQAVIPDYMVPFVPVIQAGEKPWSMFRDLWVKHREWVFEPLEYSSIDELIPRLRNAIVLPALERRKALLARKAEEIGTRSLELVPPDEDIADDDRA